MTTLRNFNEKDWYGFAGSEKFRDGGAPMIGEGETYTIIVSANRIAVYVDFPDEGEEYAYYFPTPVIADKVILVHMSFKLIQELDSKTEKEIVEYFRSEYGIEPTVF